MRNVNQYASRPPTLYCSMIWVNVFLINVLMPGVLVLVSVSVLLCACRAVRSGERRADGNRPPLSGRGDQHDQQTFFMAYQNIYYAENCAHWRTARARRINNNTNKKKRPAPVGYKRMRRIRRNFQRLDSADMVFPAATGVATRVPKRRWAPIR